MSERTQIAVKLIASHIILITGLLIISCFTSKYAIISLCITQTTLCILFLAGYWEFFGLRLKKIFCGLIELFLLLAFIHKIRYGLFKSPNIITEVFLLVLGVFLAIVLIRILIVIGRKEKTAIEIVFPFKKGMYLITDGGNSKISRLMNYHYYSAVHKRKKTNNSMLYATDIVKLKNYGPLFLPRKNEDYPVFGENIYSPMDGMIVKAENDIEDNTPFSGNYPYNTGNTIVIKNGELYLLMGHLRKGSITVKEGDFIHKNDLIGAAGNSGLTERPHLHMQLIRSDTANFWHGTGVAILFKNKNLYKNRLIRRVNSEW